MQQKLKQRKINLCQERVSDSMEMEIFGRWKSFSEAEAYKLELLQSRINFNNLWEMSLINYELKFSIVS